MIRPVISKQNMITGVKAISVFDPATGTTVQLNNIVPEADVKIKRPIEILDVDNEIYYDGDDSFLKFASFSLDGYDQLETWMKNNTQVQLVVVGVDYNLLWYESAKISVYKKYGFKTGNRNIFIVRISKSRGTHNIYALTNLLRSNGKWEDANLDEQADMLSFDNRIGTIFEFSETSSPVYQQVNAGLFGEAITSSIIFPFSDITIYGKCNAFSFGGGGGYEFNFKIQAIDYAGIFLGESSIINSNSVLNLLLPANTYRIKWIFEIDISGNERFYLPYLGMQRGNYSNINF